MTRFRFNIAQLMAVVLYFGFGFAALRNANPFWASVSHTLAILLILAAVVGALAQRGVARLSWAGIAIFGWAYLLIELLPDRAVGSFGAGPIPWPGPLIEIGTAQLQPYIHPFARGSSDYVEYDQVSHSLGLILFALLGGMLGRIFARKARAHGCTATSDQPVPPMLQ
jgi:hypothetical protein